MPPDSATAPSAGDTKARGPQPVASGMDGGPINEVATPAQQTPGTLSPLSQRPRPSQVSHGPRPTSDNRRKESSKLQAPIRQVDLNHFSHPCERYSSDPTNKMVLRASRS